MQYLLVDRFWLLILVVWEMFTQLGLWWVILWTWTRYVKIVPALLQKSDFLAAFFYTYIDNVIISFCIFINNTFDWLFYLWIYYNCKSSGLGIISVSFCLPVLPGIKWYNRIFFREDIPEEFMQNFGTVRRIKWIDVSDSKGLSKIL